MARLRLVRIGDAFVSAQNVKGIKRVRTHPPRSTVHYEGAVVEVNASPDAVLAALNEAVDLGAYAVPLDPAPPSPAE